ncbi:uncharacterized protein LOC104415231 isoform X1 [Eucalyptus grandis]|uniref:uncharacterized protein LOC104415231 isoform X1 n=1 Tax=Eucalyptus grandis TaxID=71139 RepID=UPI00192EC32F|nr:uncharacterized protein LOC104415231 isoform X1 [Eucalyptus grandis]
MEICRDGNPREADREDPFLAFVERARSALTPEELDETGREAEGGAAGAAGPSWSWIVSRILRTCVAYSSGVTAAILLSDLSQAWNEQQRVFASKRRPECINLLQRNHRRAKLPNTVTIDSIYEKRFLSLSSVLEAVVVDAFVLPGTNVYMLTLGDFWSSNTIDLYLHRRYYDLVNPPNGILKKGREIFLTGCHLRTAAEGSGYPRLLPTEYLVILLDEDQDDDAILLGAQFCSDSFASISLDAVNRGVSYSLYARIEAIGPAEIQGSSSSLQRRKITLVDNDGSKLKFLLWGEQIILANLFSVGSMIALDRPYIANCIESALETAEELCLEYGSATQLYLVPFIQHEEQVYVALSQNRCQGSRLLAAVDPTQSQMVSQVTLPRDSQGSIDFTNYPFQSFVIDLRDKMTGISLYGVVTDAYKEVNTAGVIFSLCIEDTTGAVWARLHFSKSWSLKRLSCGHTIYISGLTCSMTKNKCLEVLWFENDGKASLVNLSSLPAMLNSSCLHRLSCISDLSSHSRSTQICKVWLDQIEHCQIDVRLSHVCCGHFVRKTPPGNLECSFCRCGCDSEVVSTFALRIVLADDTGKIFAWCTGQTASELLQITPDEFDRLPEDEQLIYPTSLENEKFVVAVVNCRRHGYGLSTSLSLESDTAQWEIIGALRHD